MLLTAEEIREKLDDEFLELEPDIVGYRLVEPGLPADQIKGLEADLGISLPRTFTEMIGKYDFGDLTIGGVWFGNGGSYESFLLRQNMEGVEEYPWWGAEQKPEHLNLIAASDGYVFLLDSKTGEVLAYLRSESWREARVVSKDFHTFLLAVGTVYLQRQSADNRKEFAELIKSSAGSDPGARFWHELVEGIT